VSLTAVTSPDRVIKLDSWYPDETSIGFSFDDTNTRGSQVDKHMVQVWDNNDKALYDLDCNQALLLSNKSCKFDMRTPDNTSSKIFSFLNAYDFVYFRVAAHNKYGWGNYSSVMCSSHNFQKFKTIPRDMADS
jgi:hypothetical protein